MRPTHQESLSGHGTLPLAVPTSGPRGTSSMARETPPMWSLILITYAVVLLVLIAAAALVAISTDNHRRGTRAQAVLKILVGAAFGASGLFVLAIRLHESGLL